MVGGSGVENGLKSEARSIDDVVVLAVVVVVVPLVRKLLLLLLELGRLSDGRMSVLCVIGTGRQSNFFDQNMADLTRTLYCYRVVVCGRRR